MRQNHHQPQQHPNNHQQHQPHQLQQPHQPQQHPNNYQQHPAQHQTRGVSVQLRPHPTQQHREQPQRDQPIQQPQPQQHEHEHLQQPPRKVPRTNRVAQPPKPKPDPVQATQIGFTDEQRGQIQRYLQLDDEIANINGQLKQLREERKELHDEVLSMIRPLEAPVRAGTNILRARKKMVKETVNQKFLSKKLAECGELKDPTKANDLVKVFYKDREATEDYELVRAKDK